MISYINPPELGDYSAAGLSSGTATDKFVYAAGLAMDPATLKRRSDAATIAEEVRICLENIEHILKAEGLDRRDIVKTTCYLRSNEHRVEFFTAYKKEFGDGPYPARCTFVLGIASDLNVQIEAIAARRI